MRSASVRIGAEWPTMTLLLGCYTAFILATAYWEAIPVWVLLPLGAYIVALHGGLQHEIIHGHPTRSALVNELLASLPMMLWVPYRRYRTQHLRHHNNDRLTDPFDDPESFYLEPGRWQRLPAVAKAVLIFNNTLLGRLTVGTAISVTLFWCRELRLIAGGDRKVLSDWLLHAPVAALVIFWVVYVCGMPLWLYILCFAYPGTALIMMRSFAEHRAHEEVAARTIVIEACKPLSLLYLYNNLHSAHHDRPELAWYKLPAYYAENKERLLAENRHYFVRGYGRLILRFLLRAKEPVAHPLRPAVAPAPTHPVN